MKSGDGTTLPTPGHLAAYAGLATVTPRSGGGICDWHPPRGGNKQLSRALFLAAFADSIRRVCCDRKREPKANGRNAAPVRLARRRCDVLCALLRDNISY